MSTTTEWDLVERRRFFGRESMLRTTPALIVLFAPLYGLWAASPSPTTQRVPTIVKGRNYSETGFQTFVEGRNNSEPGVSTFVKLRNDMEPDVSMFVEERNHSQQGVPTFFKRRNLTGSRAETVVEGQNHSQPGVPTTAEGRNHSEPGVPTTTERQNHSGPGVHTTVKGRNHSRPGVPTTTERQNHSGTGVPTTTEGQNHTGPGVPTITEGQNHSEPFVPTTTERQNHSEPGVHTTHTTVKGRNHSRPGVPTTTERKNHSGPGVHTTVKGRNHSRSGVPTTTERQNHSGPGVHTTVKGRNHSRPGVSTIVKGRKPERGGTRKIGRVVPFGEYRYVVAVYHSEHVYPICAGVIMSQLSVMTSCTCITEGEYVSYAFPETLKTLLVIAGNPDALSSFHESRTVVDYKLHPYCSNEWVGTRADLAVLKINKSFQTRFYKHVAIVPRFGDSERETQNLRHELAAFMNKRIFCDVVTYGYYDYGDDSESVHREYRFFKNHTMRAIQVVFVLPAQHCAATCPNKTHCVYDYFRRDTACVSGVDEVIGPCGVLPGSPLICQGHFWGMYTGQRNCTVPRAAGVPTLVSFVRFFDSEHDHSEEHDHSHSAHCSRPTIWQIVVSSVISMLSYSTAQNIRIL